MLIFSVFLLFLFVFCSLGLVPEPKSQVETSRKTREQRFKIDRMRQYHGHASARPYCGCCRRRSSRCRRRSRQCLTKYITVNQQSLPGSGFPPHRTMAFTSAQSSRIISFHDVIPFIVDFCSNAIVTSGVPSCFIVCDARCTSEFFRQSGRH